MAKINEATSTDLPIIQKLVKEYGKRRMSHSFEV